MKKYIFLAALTLNSILDKAQQNSGCIKEIQEIEQRMSNQSDSASYQNKNIHFSYTIKTMDWDDETTISNVELYRNKSMLHMFTEHANMFMDGNEVVVEMPELKVIIYNTLPADAKNRTLFDNYHEIRKEFLDSCVVKKCETISQNKKILVLASNPNFKTISSFIEFMTYEYDPINGILYNVKIEYNEDYKLKTLTTIYKKLDADCSYNFKNMKSNYIDKNGRLTKKYHDFELVDNTKTAGLKKKN